MVARQMTDGQYDGGQIDGAFNRSSQHHGLQRDVAAVRRAAKRAVQRGVLLAPDAAGIRRAAAASDVGR
jgi:hypothetical protein